MTAWRHQLNAFAAVVAGEGVAVVGYWDTTLQWLRGDYRRDIDARCVQPLLAAIDSERLLLESVADVVGQCERMLWN